MPFIGGVYMVTPGASVVINDSNFQGNPSVGGLGLLLIGSSNDGEPNTPITISSPQDAINKLKGGDLCQGALLAFGPSGSLKGVSSLTVIRPELATQATGAIGTVIDLTTTSYGTPANLSKWMVTTGSTSGYKVSLASDYVGPGGAAYPTISQDNISLDVISIYYDGTGTNPTYTVNDSELVLAATTSDTGGTITFTSTMTVQQLVNQINALPGWVAAVVDLNPNDLVEGLFDYVSTATSVTSGATPTPVYLTGNVAAVTNWINSTGSYFTAVRQANPASVSTSSSWTYATGGTTPAPTNSDWQNAYTTAQGVTGIACVVPVIGSASIWAMNDAHCSYMTSIGQTRHGYVGDVTSQSQSTEQTNVAALNSPYTTFVWPGQKLYNYNGVLTTMGSYLLACAVAGARCGNPPPTSLTNQPFTSYGMETTLSPALVAQANAAGIACFRVNSQGVVVLSWDRTTYIAGTAYDKVENLSAYAEGMLVDNLNTKLKTYVGQPVTAGLLGHIQAGLWGVLNDAYKSGWLAVAPKISDVTVTASGQVVSASANAYIIVPANYVTLTLNALAFSGSV